MRLTTLFKGFFESERSSGILLIVCTIISLIVTNSILGTGYLDFWQSKFQGLTIELWVNDGLMTIFFLLVGLELVREFNTGELSNIKDALFPTFGAIGGMIVPASIYLLFNFGSATQSGAGIPMATDIAFALGMLSLLGKRVPTSLKIFLTALAVIDDLGAIVVIAIFYTKTILWENLLISSGIFVLLLLFNKLKIKSLILYMAGGVVMWYFMLHSGVHATITGVLLAFAIPFGKGEKKSPAYQLENFLNKPVAFIILPVFALANTAIPLTDNIAQIFSERNSMGIALGLIIGKPLGIFLITYLMVKFKICRLPKSLNWKTIFGVGILAGIGFTMSFFITMLAFDNEAIINDSKLTIMLSSLTAAILGFVTLSLILKPVRK